MSIRPLSALVILALAASSATAGEYNMALRVDDIRLGKQVHGTPVSADDLRGRVVVLEFWGINCGPCLASLPHLARLSEELAPFGLVVVGAQMEKATAKEVRDRAQSRDVKFAVVQETSVKGGNDFNGIPHTMIFDHAGKCIFRGHPTKMEPTLRAAVGRALAEKITVRQPTAAVESLLADARKGATPMTTLAKAIDLGQSSDRITAMQARQVAQRLSDMVGPDDPAEALRRLEGLAKARAERSAVAKETVAQKSENPAKPAKPAKTELATKTKPGLDAARRLDTTLKAAGDPTTPEFRSAHRGDLLQLEAIVRMMKRQWPESPATSEALQIAARYGVAAK